MSGIVFYNLTKTQRGSYNPSLMTRPWVAINLALWNVSSLAENLNSLHIFHYQRKTLNYIIIYSSKHSVNIWLIKFNVRKRILKICRKNIFQYDFYASGFTTNSGNHKAKLEQLECLRSEDIPATPWLPILLIQIGSQVKTRQCQIYKFKKFAKILNFSILKKTWCATHFVKLLDKICKYDMDPTSIVEDTEQTRFWPQTDRQMDGHTGKVKPVYPSSTSLSRCYNNNLNKDNLSLFQ